MVKAALVLMLNKVRLSRLFTAIFSFLTVIGIRIDRLVEAKTRRWYESAEIVRASFFICSNLLSGLILVLTAIHRYSISSYGDRPNTYEEVSEYFRAHFIQTQKRKDPSRRSLYVVSGN